MVAAKRPSQKLGHGNGDKEPSRNTRIGHSAGKPVVPNPDSNWHPVAQGVYKSLIMSGQSQWMETTDWALAWVMCEVCDQMYTHGFTGALLAQFNDMSSKLLMCEGDRRKARIELIRAGGDVDEDESEYTLKEIREAMKLTGKPPPPK